MSNTNNVTFDNSVVYTAVCKWFNNKAGFGFLTVLAGDKKNEDVFVHHSGINVGDEQYKYLVQGEYVNFKLTSSENTEHPYQATSITGICGGPLMCETRNVQRKLQLSYDNENSKVKKGKWRNNTNKRAKEGEKWVLTNRNTNSSD